METTLMQLISTLSAIVISLGGTPAGLGEVVTPVPMYTPVHLENGLFVDAAGNLVSLSTLYNACTNEVGIELPACL